MINIKSEGNLRSVALYFKSLEMMQADATSATISLSKAHVSLLLFAQSRNPAASAVPSRLWVIVTKVLDINCIFKRANLEGQAHNYEYDAVFLLLAKVMNGNKSVIEAGK
jgi:hypothetical protein